MASKGTVEAHLIPGLDLGITALGGASKATVSLNLDASASVTLTLNASAVATVTPRSSVDMVPHDETAPAAMARADTASTGVNGCIDVGAALNVNAGADAKFFAIFDANAKVNLFTQKFDFFNVRIQFSVDLRDIRF